MERPSPEFLTSLNNELALAIGNAVWAFAKIEWAVTSALGRAGNELDHILAEFPLKQRTTVLRKLLPELAVPKDVQVRVATSLTSIESLSTRRNLIAHNPWMVWMDLDAREIMTEIQHYARPERKLDLSSLSEFTEECQRVLDEFEAAVVAL